MIADEILERAIPRLDEASALYSRASLANGSRFIGFANASASAVTAAALVTEDPDLFLGHVIEALRQTQQRLKASGA